MRNPDAHRDAATWLHFAATPAFAAMALWTTIASNPMDMLCAPGVSSWNGMALMYVLMATFHAGPWWTWIARSARRWGIPYFVRHPGIAKRYPGPSDFRAKY